LRASAEFSATTLIDSQPDEVSLGQQLSNKSLPAATKVASLPVFDLHFPQHSVEKYQFTLCLFFFSTENREL
jgi:hypothetical protein